MLLFGLGKLVYVIVLLLNAISILSEDRFLARIGWGRTQASEPGFGAAYDSTSVKAKSVNLIASVRTVMRIPLIAINTIIIVYELILG
ncbi:protein transport protein YOS1 [Paecilomyces variotii No. 5]|uniref:Protein transport protein YOS1 n=1 Tax=Byssochlamys spectabilis (strain No. 5 / NBRC 109023) TaxID=1356009 RepID=V5FPT8_BYSSN|nr:protein transport protein YOS1 [Paecilomyces variotii No. 5]